MGQEPNVGPAPFVPREVRITHVSSPDGEGAVGPLRQSHPITTPALKAVLNLLLKERRDLDRLPARRLDGQEHPRVARGPGHAGSTHGPPPGPVGLQWPALHPLLIPRQVVEALTCLTESLRLPADGGDVRYVLILAVIPSPRWLVGALVLVLRAATVGEVGRVLWPAPLSAVGIGLPASLAGVRPTVLG